MPPPAIAWRAIRPLAPSAALLSLALALPAAAVAATPGAPPDVRDQSCATLYGGTVNAPDTVPFARIPQAGSFAGWPKAPAGLLPRRVFLRGATETYNGRFAFATRGGEIYVEPVGGGGDGDGWRRLPLPACFAGRVTSISADDDELIALDEQRRVFTMDNALKGPALFNWTRRWGPPLWRGPGRTVPGDAIAWSWSVLSPAEDRTWHDTAGNPHAVGDAKVSHIWALRAGGQRLSFFDPWLPDDTSYELCGPHRGRFRAAGLSTSGSTIFVIGRHGDLFTRLYDFDISGSDPIFFSYSYRPQRKGDPKARIQLPSPPWVHQPKVPGRITSAISVEKTGVGAVHRILRVEGLDRRGRTGYWQKDVTAMARSAWRFHRTGLPLRGGRLPNPPGDTSRAGQGRAADLSFAGRAGALRVAVPDFNVHCTPATLAIRAAGGRSVRLRLHSVDGLRQVPRATGLDASPREQYGAIEVPPSLRARLGAQPAAVRALVRHTLHGRRFTEVRLEVTAGALRIKELGWTLRR
jgi:hypothetical protein